MNRGSDTKIIINRWKNTRFWAVWLNKELLAVVLYKKGAMAIKKAFLSLRQGYTDK
jgi:hypothetical protein